MKLIKTGFREWLLTQPIIPFAVIEELHLAGIQISRDALLASWDATIDNPDVNVIIARVGLCTDKDGITRCKFTSKVTRPVGSSGAKSLTRRPTKSGWTTTHQKELHALLMQYKSEMKPPKKEWDLLMVSFTELSGKGNWKNAVKREHLGKLCSATHILDKPTKSPLTRLECLFVSPAAVTDTVFQLSVDEALSRYVTNILVTPPPNAVDEASVVTTSMDFHDFGRISAAPIANNTTNERLGGGHWGCAVNFLVNVDSDGQPLAQAPIVVGTDVRGELVHPPVEIVVCERKTSSLLDYSGSLNDPRRFLAPHSEIPLTIPEKETIPEKGGVPTFRGDWAYLVKLFHEAEDESGALVLTGEEVNAVKAVLVSKGFTVTGSGPKRETSSVRVRHIELPHEGLSVCLFTDAGVVYVAERKQ